MTAALLSQLEPVLGSALLAQAGAHAGSAPFPIAEAVTDMGWAGFILWFPILAMIMCGICAALRIKTKAPAWITVGLLGASFVVTVILYLSTDAPVTIRLFDWFDMSWGPDGAQTFVAHTTAK